MSLPKDHIGDSELARKMTASNELPAPADVSARRFFQLLSSAAFSGVIARSIVHPMDTIRARMMVQSSGSLKSAMMNILHTDGWKGLYRGVGVTVVVQAPAIATYLMSYDYAKDYMSSRFQTGVFHSSPALVHLCCGLFAETISAMFWVPMEVIKQRVQVRNTYTSSYSVLRDLIRNEGAHTLFKGYWLTVGVFGPYAMIYFMCYEKTKALSGTYFGQSVDQLNSVGVLGSAAVSAGIAAACTTPLDVVKTRLQTQGDLVASIRSGNGNPTGMHSGNMEYRSTMHAIRSIVSQYGIRGLFRGISARILWISPQTAITFGTFERIKQYLYSNDNNSRRDEL